MAAGYLIDTNVISELRRRLPEPRVVQWFAERPAGQLFLSVLTLGEIRRGVERLEPSERQQALREWLEQELPAYFAGRLLPIDAPSPIAGDPCRLNWDARCRRSTACWRPRPWSTTWCW
jgi:predicted nucleic acid-binding protein